MIAGAWSENYERAASLRLPAAVGFEMRRRIRRPTSECSLFLPSFVSAQSGLDLPYVRMLRLARTLHSSPLLPAIRPKVPIFPATSVMTFSSAPPALQRPTSKAALEAMQQHDIERHYRPFLAKKGDEEDWVERLELDTVQRMAKERSQPIKVLVLYGSLRER